MSHDYDAHDLPWDDRDDGQQQHDAQQLGEERRERMLLALYSVAMCGMVSEEDVRHLCGECGLTYRDLETYTPPILRTTNQPETPSTLELGF